MVTSDVSIAASHKGRDVRMVDRDDSGSSAQREAFLARVAAILDNSNGQVPTSLREVVEGLEKNAIAVAATRNLTDEFEKLLSSNPREEKLHAFIRSHPALLNVSTYGSARATQGLLSKFPISPDRVADFVYLSVSFDNPQYPDRIDVFEIKRADVKLFTTHNRFSKDLNDAWMEGVESLRLISLNYIDFVRRAVKRLATQTRVRRSYASAFVSDYRRPRVRVRIIIGRRSTLSAEDRARIRELDFSTNSSIAVVTYDSLLDELRGQEPADISRWRW